MDDAQLPPQPSVPRPAVPAGDRAAPPPARGSPAGAAAPPRRAGPQALRFLDVRRSQQRRIVAGVAGGIGERLQIEPTIVRMGFVLLSLCAGAGLLIYAVLWAALPATGPGDPTALAPGIQRGVAVALVVAGFAVLLRAGGLWFGNAIGWSVGLVALGIGVVWLRGDEAEQARWTRMARSAPGSAVGALTEGRIGKLRLAAGGLLALVGVIVFLSRTNVLQVHATVVVAVAATAVGAALIAGPWAWRLVVALSVERRERIRSEERAELAAHLHDSVLQTLALIQRTDQPREMVALARNQERELRAWLGGRQPPSFDQPGVPPSVAHAVEQVASTVELKFKVPVDVVTVGDTVIDERLQAVIDACREAAVNAAKHSGADRVSIYVEVEPQAVTAYVRDQGCGFDPWAVAVDRRGIAESIRGRMFRSGGSATIVSEPGGGTEVQLVLPRAPRTASRGEAGRAGTEPAGGS
jgi:signal transduction histidine kinase/phage shock protein PspC (stress-responsive transcriptional regulator)